MEKHYRAIAKIIREEYGLAKPIGIKLYRHGRLRSVSNIAKQLADYFKQGNPQFDQGKFLKACKLEE